MKKILIKIIGYLPILFLLAAIALVVDVTVSIRNGQAPTLFGRAAFYVETPSMEPTIMTGDVIFVDANANTYHIGDIISYHRPDQPAIIITHRIVDIENDNGTLLYTTRGDNNGYSLDWEIHFTQDHIIGKYISKSTFIGEVYRNLFSDTKTLVFVGLISIFLIIGLMELVNIIRAVTNEKAKKALEEREKMVSEELKKLKEKQEEDKLT